MPQLSATRVHDHTRGVCGCEGGGGGKREHECTCTQAAEMTKAPTRVNMHSGKVDVRKVNVSNKVYTYNRHKGNLHLSLSTSVHCQHV